MERSLRDLPRDSCWFAYKDIKRCIGYRGRPSPVGLKIAWRPAYASVKAACRKPRLSRSPSRRTKSYRSVSISYAQPRHVSGVQASGVAPMWSRTVGAVALGVGLPGASPALAQDGPSISGNNDRVIVIVKRALEREHRDG